MPLTQPKFDLEFYPPFEGFPKEGIAFLKKLKKNNDRLWFAKHKAEYEDFVKLPVQSLIATLQPLMAKVAPEFELHPKRSMYRIYRDTRFSKDKTPYKTHVAASFKLRGHGGSGAGLYLHIEPGEVWLGGGIYMPESHELKKIRLAIADQPQEFQSIVSDDAFVKRFGSMQGEKLQRLPLGFPADHLMASWLKYKQFYTGASLPEEVCHSSKFIKKAISVYEDILPLVRFLNGALGVGG